MGPLGRKNKIQAENRPWQAWCSTSLGIADLSLSASLQGHPFIVQFNDGNAAVVSMWVCRALKERRSQQGPP
ncbi:Dual specificity mitogen-activated protein kinase kinase 5 [Myotis davidii]|uniref:Dual specificity mitogen-activated protein kinase kinase 5 n=1 Tax=Myotis davidii TaxID=225400 RepID=L5M6Q0_MYODS|nr:Dual specificity mitogen-activated protein kinase kinase 5 [Myotis davidii]